MNVASSGEAADRSRAFEPIRDSGFEIGDLCVCDVGAPRLFDHLVNPRTGGRSSGRVGRHLGESPAPLEIEGIVSDRLPDFGGQLVDLDGFCDANGHRALWAPTLSQREDRAQRSWSRSRGLVEWNRKSAHLRGKSREIHSLGSEYLATIAGTSRPRRWSSSEYCSPSRARSSRT